MLHQLAGNVRGNTEGNAQPVPAVDGDDAVHERGHLSLRELCSCGIVHRVRYLAIRDAGDRFGQRQGSPLARGENRRLAPGPHQVQPQLVLAELARVRDMHRDAKGTAVDLRGAHFDQLQQAMVQAALIDDGLQAAHGLICLGNKVELEPGTHADLLKTRVVPVARMLGAWDTEKYQDSMSELYHDQPPAADLPRPRPAQPHLPADLRAHPERDPRGDP